MDFFRINGNVLRSRFFTVCLACMAIAGTSFTRAYGQGARSDLLLPDTPDYASLSENGKHLFDGLTNKGQYQGETIIVRMRPIAEVLSNNRMQITIPGRAETHDVHIKTIEYSDDRNYKLYGTVGEVMSDKSPIVKAFRPEPNVLSGSIYGPTSGYAYQVYTYEAIAKCGSPPYSYQWKESSDGINYSGNGTGEFYNVGLYHNGNHLFYLKLKITSADGQMIEYWMQIWVDDDPNGGYRKGQKDGDSLQMKAGKLFCSPIRLPAVWNSFSVLKRLRRSGLA